MTTAFSIAFALFLAGFIPIGLAFIFSAADGFEEEEGNPAGCLGPLGIVMWLIAAGFVMAGVFLYGLHVIK